MIDLKAAAKNPAYTLSAMIYGLQNPIETEDMKYEVQMTSYAGVNTNRTICYGCAATSAFEVITGRSVAENVTRYFMNDNQADRAALFNASQHETVILEDCIDLARRGSFDQLMKFFDSYDGDSYDGDKEYDQVVTMGNCDWQKKVPIFEKIINKMHEDHPHWERFEQQGEQDD